MFLFFSISLFINAKFLKKWKNKEHEGFFEFYYSEKMTFSTRNS